MTIDKGIEHQIEELVSEAERGALRTGAGFAVERGEGRARL
jgi:hypothetical protein